MKGQIRNKFWACLLWARSRAQLVIFSRRFAEHQFVARRASGTGGLALKKLKNASFLV